jgi:deoxyribose-phosphate aldolase
MAARTNASWHDFLSPKISAIINAPPPPAVPLPVNIASTIDHTLLAPTATPQQITSLCAAAKKYGFASVCVNSSHAALASEEGAPMVCVVVGFPLGACSASVKAAETRGAIQDGAREIDTVLAVGLLKAQEYERVFNDIRAVVEAAQPWPVKVIIETALLTEEEKVAACLLAAEAGAAFVKTCTGFSGGGATAEDVALMRRAVDGYTWSGGEYTGPVRVKASGGVRDWEAARRVLEAGASRIGTSSGVAIMEGGSGEGY